MASTASQRRSTDVADHARDTSPVEDAPPFGALDESLAQLEAKLSALQARVPGEGAAGRSRSDAEPAAEPVRRARPASALPDDDPFERLARRLPVDPAPRHEPAPLALSVPGDTSDRRFTGALTREIGRMRSELTGEMHGRFEELGREIVSLRTAVASERTGAKLEAEFDRVYDGLEAVASALDKQGDRNSKHELEALRREVSKLAAEDTLHAIGRGQDELARRLMQHHAAVDPEIASIRGQIDELAAKIDAGDLQGLKAIERRIAGLSQAIEAVRDQVAPQDLSGIEARLDDIARGVIAASQTVQEIDTAPFERLEARIANQQRRLDERDKRRDADYADAISGIAKRLEFVNDAQAKTVEATNRVAGELTERFDRMAERAAAERERSGIDLSPRFEQIASHVQGVNDRIEDWGQRLDGWGQRLTDATNRPREAEIGMFKALAARLDAVSDRLSDLPSASADEQNWAALEARMSAVLQKLDRVPTDTLDYRSLEELRSQLAAIAWRLEQPTGKPEGHDEVTGRLDAIAERVAENRNASIDEDAIARIGEVVGTRLADDLEGRLAERVENQLSTRLTDLTEVLHRTTAPLADFGSRMEALEESMGDAQVTLVDTARSAAEDVVRAMLEQSQQMAPAEAEAVNALDEDLQRLEELTRSTDERNTKTFDAVHDTLMKIVERLDALDSMVSKATQAPDPAVIAATHAALMQSQQSQAAPNSASLMDRLRGRAGQAEPAAPAAVPAMAAAPVAHGPAPMDAFEGLDPDTPLEPETGEPSVDDAPSFDPAAIVADVRAGDAPNDPGADFLAVARRKAQAVAAEAAFEGVEVEGKSKKGRAKTKKANGKAKAASEGGDSALAKFRRPLLVAAAVAITAALVLPNILSTVGGVVPPAPEPSVAETPQAGEPGDELFGEVQPVAADAAATVADPDGADVTRFTVPVETIGSDEADGIAGTDATTTRSIDPVEAVEDDFVDVVETVGETIAGPVEGLNFSSQDGPAPLVAAAEEGDARALFEIAGRTNDAARAFALYEAAAERGLAPAQYRLGQAYEKGRGTPVDTRAAKRWYAQAADAGNTSAMHNLAVLHAMGVDGPADPKMAGEWFTKAAMFGVKDSQYNLGILHAQGSGVSEDLTESYKWFDAASEAGDPEAGGKRDEVAGALDPADLEVARAKAAAFRPQVPDMAANRVSIPDAWRDAPVLGAEDMQRAVRNVQAILNKNGFDAGAPDGVMGKKTRTAILQFQEQSGLPKTGTIDDALVKALLAKNS